MQSTTKKFYDLTQDEIHDIYQARAEVFVVEQNCVYQDFDGLDKESLHTMLSENGRLAAYCRLVPPGMKYPEWAICRVLTLPHARGKGVGRLLMDAAIKAIADQRGQAVRISAQSYLLKFYEGYGFVRQGDEYLEDNIPHIEMLKSLSI